MALQLKERLKKSFKILFIFFILFFLFIELKKFIFDVNSNSIFYYLSNISVLKYLIIIFSGILAFLPMCLYDLTLKPVLKSNITNKYILKYSWICASISNIIGFAGSTSIGLKLHFYKNYYLDKKTFLTHISQILFFNISGLSLLCLFHVIFNFKFLFLNSINKPLIPTLTVLLLSSYIIGLCVYLVFNQFKHSNPKNISKWIKIILISCLEWILATLLLYFIARLINISISFKDYFPIFILSVSIGIVSMIPGGFGSFDLTFLLNLEILGVSKELGVIALILYRLSYYIIPLILGLITYLYDNWKNLNSKFNGVPSLILSSSANFILMFLIFSTGIVLLISAALPSVIYRLKLISHIANYYIINLSHMISVIIGFLLISLSRIIHYKSKDVYKLTLLLLICGSIFTFAKGLDYEEALYLAIVGFILFISKKSFYREKFIMTWGRILQDFIILFFIFIIYAFIGYINAPSSQLILPSFLENLVYTNYKHLIISSFIGFIIALAFLLLIYKKNKNKIPPHLTLDKCENELDNFLSIYEGSPLTHLIYLKDKMLYFNKNKDVLFQFSVYSDKLVVLGGPIGNKYSIQSAIEEFYDYYNKYGYTPVFYQVDKNTLSFLHEFGYDFLKLGEEAKISIDSFSLTGKRMKGIRTSINKVEKEGYMFEVIKPPFTSSFLNELKSVSDNWLDGKDEKGFSLGFFDEYYLSKSPICVVQDANYNIMGFSNIMPMYDNDSFSIDLMRFSKNACRGIMDFMFVNLINYGSKNKFKFFNIGMAPLSNVGTSKYSFLSEKIASQVYSHGQHFYSFQGLRSFKEKYATTWEPKYLAYRKRSSLLFTMMQVTLLISRKIKYK